MPLQEADTSDQFEINCEKAIEVIGVQTLAYCLINSRVEVLGFRLIKSMGFPSEDVVKFPIGKFGLRFNLLCAVI